MDGGHIISECIGGASTSFYDQLELVSLQFHGGEVKSSENRQCQENKQEIKEDF